MVQRAANHLFQEMATKAYWSYMSTVDSNKEEPPNHCEILQEIGSTCWEDAVEIVLGAVNSHRDFSITDIPEENL